MSKGTRPIDAPEEVADVDWERRWGRPVGVLAILSVVGTIAAVPVAASDIARDFEKQNDKTVLINSGLSGDGQFTAMVLRVLCILVLIPFALYTFRAIRDRGNESYVRYIPILGLAAIAVVSISTAIGFLDQRDAGREFVALAEPMQTLARAEELTDDLTKSFAAYFNVFGGFLFGLWISMTAAELMRVGLTTRFLGLFGLGAGITTVIGSIFPFPISSALFIAWLGSVGVLAFGYWPGGRPLAWQTGRAESPMETEADGQFKRRGSESV
ncbi:hypothetical protein DSM112329_00891 [Paraconexibacter sp. AEG42_29]|uniref:DUF4386 domain-containing protein n=1 Tax=Paraconexibacter sp. AEG42_29 TaxID=2997339 RepID=A0AAU7AQU7_9ACTN